MKVPGKASSCPSRKCNKPGMAGGRLAPRKNGYVLLIVMMMATILLISLTAALPNVYVEGQRQREEELIFRGQQYARAIALFHQQFNRYPTSVKELLHTDNMSFLRHAYRDPMTKSGKWRFIHASANGVILDSKLLGSTGQQKNSKGEGSQTNTPTTGERAQGTASGESAAGGGGFSLSGGQGTQGFSSGQESGQQGQGSSMFGDQNQLIGAYIVGVASTSTKTSIKVFEGRTHYDKWEFLGVPGAPGGPAVGAMGGVPAAEQGTSAPTSQSPQFNPNSNPQPSSIFGGGSNQ